MYVSRQRDRYRFIYRYLVMARSTKEEAIETRSRILDAAVEVFHATGVARTSLADVAAAAQVTRGAIYWHFKNKADLFHAMCDRVRLPMVAMTHGTSNETKGGALHTLRAACLFAVHNIVNNAHSRKVFDIIFHKCEFVDADDSIWERQRDHYQRGLGNIGRLLTAARSEGSLPGDLDIGMAVAYIHALVYGLINNWLLSPSSFDLGGQIEQLIDAGLDALRYAPSLRSNPLAQ